ncbi:MAG: TatD family hydrolase [Chloroflexi bacterium]|nr:TatD family hydrolase [Chloroflexota bacterium]
MIDSHVHLEDPKLAPDADTAVRRAVAVGVRAMITAGVDLPSSGASVDFTERYPQVYAAVGFHPHDAEKMSGGDLDRLRALAAHPKVVAIGEIGLDYYRDHSPRPTQRRVLEQHLELAADLALPVVVHSREAAQETRDILSRWARQAAGRYAERPLGMLHCFSGDLAAALGYVELGFFISLAGPVTYPNARKTHQVATGVPLDRLLVETDAPYLPPQGLRGQRNEPANVAAVVAQIAQLRGLPHQVVAEATARNAAALFRLPVTVAPPGPALSAVEGPALSAVEGEVRR